MLSEGVSGTPMPGVEVSGTVALTAGDVSKATVVLTTATIDGVANAYGYVAGENDYVAQVGADGTWKLDIVPQGTYTMLIRKPGALYYQKNSFTVGTEAITYKLVTLPVGDLDVDGTVEFSDLMLLIGERNYGKPVTDDGVLTIADFDDDGTIAFSDLMLLIGARNYTMTAHIE